MSESIGVKVDMDISGFQTSVANINRQIKVLDGQFAVATSRLNEFEKGTSGLASKASTLTKQLELQGQKVSTLQKAFETSANSKGLDAKATQDLQVKLLKAQAEMGKMETELVKTNKELEKQIPGWNNLGKKLDEVGKKATAMGAKLTSIGKNMSMYVTAPLLAIGVASTKMAMDAVESENLFGVSMGRMAASTRKWSEQLADDLKLNAYSVRENVAILNTMFISMGLGETKAKELAESLVELSYDMTSFYDLGKGEAFSKLMSGITGEIEPLRRLGISLHEQTIKTYAYKNHIASLGKELTEQQKIMARYGVIMEATAKAQGDLNRTINDPTNRLRAMREQVEELSIKIGNALLPFLEALLSVIEPIVVIMSKLDPVLLKFVVIIGMMVAAIGPVVMLIGSMANAVGGISTLLATSNIQMLKTVAVVIAVVAALTALAAIIAVIMGRSGDISRVFQSIGSGLANATSSINTRIPRYATGTSYHPGGAAIINERGGEIVDLPNGSRVIPHDISMEMAKGSRGQYIQINVQADDLMQASNFVRMLEGLQRQTRMA